MSKRLIRSMVLMAALGATSSTYAAPRIYTANRFQGMANQAEPAEDDFGEPQQPAVPRALNSAESSTPSKLSVSSPTNSQPQVVKGVNSTPSAPMAPVPEPVSSSSYNNAPALAGRPHSHFEPEFPQGFDPYTSSEYCGSGDCEGDRASYDAWHCDRYSHAPPRGWYGGFEFINWWGKGDAMPAIVTTSANGTTFNQAGVLPNATVLFGNKEVDNGPHRGVRATLGFWFDDCETHGLESTTFGMNQVGTSFRADSDANGNTIIARPFTDEAAGNAQVANVLSYPAVRSGFVHVQTKSQVFGADGYYRRALACSQYSMISALAGYRHFSLEEDLAIQDQALSINDPPRPAGTLFTSTEEIGVKNVFRGGELGLIFDRHEGRWGMTTRAKVGLGNMQQTATLSGNTVITSPNTAAIGGQGAFFVLTNTSSPLNGTAGNLGRFQRDRFATIPEINFDVKYQLNDCWEMNFGYTAMWILHVLRPGNQISTNLNSNLFPPQTDPLPATPTVPTYTFKESTYWLQGFNVGLQTRF